MRQNKVSHRYTREGSTLPGKVCGELYTDRISADSGEVLCARGLMRSAVLSRCTRLRGMYGKTGMHERERFFDSLYDDAEWRDTITLCILIFRIYETYSR